MNKDIELIREAADIIGAAGYTQPRHVGLLRALADRLEAQMKQEPVAWFEKTASGEWFLAYSLNPLAETKELFTYPPDAATRIAELESDNARLIREMLVLSVDHEAQPVKQEQEPDGFRLKHNSFDYGVTIYDKEQLSQLIGDGWELVSSIYFHPPADAQQQPYQADELENLLRFHLSGSADGFKGAVEALTIRSKK